MSAADIACPDFQKIVKNMQIFIFHLKLLHVAKIYYITIFDVKKFFLQYDEI